MHTIAPKADFTYLSRAGTLEGIREYQLVLDTKKCKKNHQVPHYGWGL